MIRSMVKNQREWAVETVILRAVLAFLIACTLWNSSYLWLSRIHSEWLCSARENVCYIGRIEEWFFFFVKVKNGIKKKGTLIKVVFLFLLYGLWMVPSHGFWDFCLNQNSLTQPQSGASLSELIVSHLSSALQRLWESESSTKMSCSRHRLFLEKMQFSWYKCGWAPGVYRPCRASGSLKTHSAPVLVFEETSGKANMFNDKMFPIYIFSDLGQI